MVALWQDSPEERMKMMVALLGSQIDKEPVIPEPGEEGKTWRQIFQEQADKERQGPFRLYSAQQVNSTAFEQRYLIPGVLAAGEPGGIYGAFKTLKTSCTADLLLSVATGTKFLGHFPVAESGPVLFLSGESGLASLQSILRRIAAARDVCLDTVENLAVSPDLPRLSKPADIKVLRQLIKERNLKVVAIDPAYLTLDLADSPRDLFAVGHHLRPLAELCGSTGCTVLVVHHCRRRDVRPLLPSTLADVAGGGFAEFSAQWILLSRRRPFDPETGLHDLWMNFGGRAGHAGCWAVEVEEGTPDDPSGRVWNVVIERPASALADADARRALEDAVRQERRAAATLLRDRARTMKLMADYPEGETPNFLRGLLGFSGDRMNRVLSSLRESGVIEPTDMMADRRGAHGYRLVGGRSISSSRTGHSSSVGPDSTPHP